MVFRILTINQRMEAVICTYVRKANNSPNSTLCFRFVICTYVGTYNRLFLPTLGTNIYLLNFIYFCSLFLNSYFYFSGKRIEGQHVVSKWMALPQGLSILKHQVSLTYVEWVKTLWKITNLIYGLQYTAFVFFYWLFYFNYLFDLKVLHASK